MNDLPSPATLLEIIGLLVAVTTFVIAQAVQKRRDRSIARRKIYQELELASIDLFRFEAGQLDLIRPVWQAGIPMPAAGTAERTVVSNYVCQILNLFELATRFRLDGTMPPDVFGSWVAWFHQLIAAPGFAEIWRESRLNYLPALREFIDDGLVLEAGESDPIVRQRNFYTAVAQRLQCPVIAHWLDETAAPGPISSEDTSAGNPIRTAADPEIGWVSDPEEIDDIVAFFIRHTDTGYISHGEIMDGRAIDTDTWSPRLRKRLHREFETAMAGGAQPPARLAIARLDGQMAGMAFVQYAYPQDGPISTLSDIVIAKADRGNGIGQALIHWLETEWRREGIRFTIAESNIGNTSAHAFLEQNGFRKISATFLKTIAK
jgi:GNAT superfamily N-acetyltransferase